MEAGYVPNIRVFDNNSRSIYQDIGYSWIADYLNSPTLSTNIFQYNGVTTSSMGAVTQGNSVNGNYTMRTVGRSNSNSTPYASSPNSRISYLLAFAPGIGMTSQTMSAVYTLCQNTLNEGTPDYIPYFSNSLPTTPLTPTAGSYSDGLQEFQAIGDWNGYRWLNKYAAPVSTIRTITGASSLFNIYPSTGQYNISKINEGWDASGYYSSLRYQESLLDKDIFFKQFLGVILGDLNAQPYELGKTVYEKIANFVDNNSDIDKVNISELISFCEELSIDFAQYNYGLPPQIRRLMDLLSIKQSILWGNSNKYTLNFNPQGTMFHNNTYGINLSSAIDPLTGTFISGTPIIAQEVFSGNYILVNTNFISGSGTVIPLSAYTPSWGWGLVVPNSSTGTAINNYYKFYNFNPQFDGTYYDNIINWTNPLTTLTPTNSSYSNWSGDNGIIQNMLSYEMTKGFKLFTSAAKITYNS